jgi:hypothetical protein
VHGEFLQVSKTTTQLATLANKIARLQKQLEALTEGLQKVSAQLELSKPAPQTVLDNE